MNNWMPVVYVKGLILRKRKQRKQTDKCYLAGKLYEETEKTILLAASANHIKAIFRLTKEESSTNSETKVYWYANQYSK
jgi:hypothetical protein